jgi:uncharacterized membrane protein
MSAEAPAVVAQPRKRWFGAPRWLVALLGVSLAVNLLIAGMVGGAIWRHRTNPQQGINMIGYIASLPAERRQMIFGKAGGHRATLRPLRMEVRDARAAVMQTLAAEPFDREKFSAAQERLTEIQIKIRKAEQAFVNDLAVNLTPEERKMFVRWREMRRGPGGPGRWGGDDGDEPAAKGPPKKP